MTDIDDVVPGFVDADSGAITLDGDDDAANYGVVDEIARRVLSVRRPRARAAPRRHPVRRLGRRDPALPGLSPRNGKH